MTNSRGFRSSHALLLLALVLSGSITPEDAKSDSLLDKAIGGTVDESIQKAKDALDAVAKENIDFFLKEARKVADDLIRKGANEGRLALVQAGNEMQIAIGVARSQFGNELDHQIQSASAALEPILLEIQRWRSTIDELESKAFEMEDLIAMDLGRLPLSPDYFGIRRLSGTAFLENAGSVYRIRVTGENFGAEIVGQKVVVTAMLGNVPLAAPGKEAPASVIFSVPATMVTGKFKYDQIETIPFHVAVTRTKDHWLWGSWWQIKTVLNHDINVALLPDLVGELLVETARPKFDWVDDTPSSQSASISADTAFTFSDLIGAPPQGPEKGSQRYGDPQATCEAITQNAWKLHNGQVVLDSHNLIQEGWISPSYVGEPEPPDWNSFDSIALDMFGWTPGFSYGRCSKKTYCTLSPAEIKEHSQPVTIPVERCARMRVVEKNFSGNKSKLVVWIRGSADQNSLWTLRVPVQTYKQVQIVKDEAESYPVYTSKPTQFDVADPELTVTTLLFKPKNGAPRSGILPGDIANGPKRIGNQPIGVDRSRYFYQFTYDKKLFDIQ